MKVNFDECYPFNVMKKILGESYEDYDFSCKLIIKVFQEDLSEREQKVLELRFIDNLTLEECGKELGISRERVRQIEAKVIRKLRHPSRIKRMEVVPYDAYLKVIDEIARLIVLSQPETNDILEKNIGELDLSVRSYNCLKRADILTVSDIVEYNKKHNSSLKGIRNLGKKSEKEILEKLYSIGVNFKGEEYVR